MTVHRLPTAREITERIEARKSGDMFGLEWGEYLEHLSFDDARQYLKPEVKSEEWKVEPLTREGLLSKMKDYMAFAWDKANNRRGISANRSVMHYVAWTWLAGDRELSDEIDRMFEHDYHYYGKPILERICEFYGWNWTEWDDGVRTNGDG